MLFSRNSTNKCGQSATEHKLSVRILTFLTLLPQSLRVFDVDVHAVDRLHSVRFRTCDKALSREEILCATGAPRCACVTTTLSIASFKDFKTLPISAQKSSLPKTHASSSRNCLVRCSVAAASRISFIDNSARPDSIQITRRVFWNENELFAVLEDASPAPLSYVSALSDRISR